MEEIYKALKGLAIAYSFTMGVFKNYKELRDMSDFEPYNEKDN